jgi:membrane protein implicated in regulation of membrane protease activity
VLRVALLGHLPAWLAFFIWLVLACVVVLLRREIRRQDQRERRRQRQRHREHRKYEDRLTRIERRLSDVESYVMPPGFGDQQNHNHDHNESEF